METKKYLSLIDRELAQMPDFVKEYQLETRHSLTTSYQYLTEMRRFFSWLIAEGLTQAKSPSQVAPADLEKLRRSDVLLYLDKLEHSKNKQGHLNSPTTVNRSLNALRSLYKYLTITADNNHGEPYFERNVMLKINSLPYTKTLNYRAHALEAHMYTGNLKYQFMDFLDQKYAAQCSGRALASFSQNKERDMAVIALILGTGIRVSECAGVDLKDFNLKEATLDVTRKGGQRDSVPVADWTLPYLKSYLEIRADRYQAPAAVKAFFLTSYHGQCRRMTTNAIEKMVGKYSAAFGHPLTPHKLRHTVASELYQATKDQVMVAQQLGQKGTSATDLYTHVDQKEQRQALNASAGESKNKPSSD
ncbi:tyrosine recombinase XerS [Lactobacillus nasalidis]|uniref:Tyrosine recombinase XerS n=1 Tax=Lactobacillus nasalidis TaxID=2797258 RepID=A0ABQ3W4P1_9LACO|nr:tyrosine recombinase XerS [Lactobacillus nasalidis]GHV97285.1 tyrosine recombinase XerS [Lactobacillus nasalidis]GHW00038.1 tyrosine recombinase XerS [Lactobacillus nasalidis]GHW01501.1 tyrosine recombinase XerS [Lactobacillus nasalidis]